MQSQTIFLGWLMISSVISFSFREVQTTPSVTTINSISSYSFRFDRTTDNTYKSTNYATQSVSSNATVTITFPSNYLVIDNSVTCLSISVDSIAVTNFSCSTSGKTVIFSNVFTSITNLYVRIVNAVVGNVLNPTPAILTGAFNGTIGADLAVEKGTGVQLTPGYLTNCSITFSPNYVYDASSTMVVSVTPTNALPVGSTVKIQFPGTSWTNDISHKALPISSSMTCANYSGNINSGIVCSGSSTTITASNIVSSSLLSPFSFGVKNFLSPPSDQPSDSIVITSYSGTSKIDTCSVYASGLIPNNFYSFSITPTSTLTINTLAGLRFSAFLAVPINQDDYFSIEFPAGITYTYNNVYGISYYELPPTISGQTLYIHDNKTIYQTYPQGSQYILTIQNITAPPSTLPTSPIVFSVLRNGYPIMSGSQSITAVSKSLTASVSVVADSKVWANTSYTFSITTTDPLSSSGLIKITMPSSVTISTNSSNCAVLSGLGIRQEPTCSISSLTNSILISNINGSSSNVGAQTLTLTINGLTNPGDISKTNDFQITTYYGNSQSGVTNTGSATGITPTAGLISIATVSVVPSSYTVYATGVTYTITFNNTYLIPVNGYIVIEIPTDIGINVVSLATYTKYSINGGAFIGTAGTGTTGASLYVITIPNIAPTSSIAANSMISLRFSGICTNPSNTRIVSPITITTFSSSAKIEAVSGITVQMTTAASFYVSDISRVSQQNSALTQYTFSLKQQAALPAGSLLFITLPNSISMTASSSCKDLGGASIVCAQTSYQALMVTLNSVIGSTLFGVVVTNIRNPPSYKPISNSFVFQTKTSDQVSTYSLQTVSNSLTNSVPSAFGSISYNFSPAAYLNGETLTLTITPSTFIAPTYYIVSLAPSFTPVSLACNSFVGFIGICAMASSSSSSLNISGMAGTSQISFSITGFTSPGSAPADYTTVASFQNGYMIDQNSSFVKFSIFCNLPCKTCSSTNKSACFSCYNNPSITSMKLYFSVGSQCVSSCSDGYYETASLTCIVCSGTCLTCSTVASNCTSCNQTSLYPALNLTNISGSCLSSCPLYFYLSKTSTPIQCLQCDSATYHCSTCSSLNVCLSCIAGNYLYSGSCSPTCPATLSVPNNGTWACDICNSECATCEISVSNCTSCSASSAYYNGKCLSACPYPLVINAGTCAGCSSTCKLCSLVYTNCTACYTNSSLPYLTVTNSGLGSCAAVCPYSYYGDIANGVCQSCIPLNIGCANCSSPAACYTCDSGYIFYLSTCRLTAPIGYYNNSGIASPCNSSCATCSNLPSNCTGCVGSLALSGFTCVSTCISGQVAVSNVCVNCSSPCLTCSGTTTTCLSCVNNTFLTNSRCESACPNYTYADSSSLTCKICPTASHCEKCTTAFSCTSCVTGYYLYNATCQSTCPSGTVGLNKLCVLCTNNCKTCIGSTSICSGCLTGYYLYNVSTPSCVNPCPSSLFMNNQTETCTGCDSSCATCGLYSTQCLSCPAGSYLQNSSCLGSCSLGYYPIGTICTACPVECAACTSSQSCSQCAFSYYLYLSSCVDTCPSIKPVINVNGVCSSCADIYCISCNSSNYCSGCYFPKVLIQGACVANCPIDYVLDENGTKCIYSPNSNTNNDTNSPTSTLTESLTTSSTFPVPFTVAAGFIGVACLMSKFQHDKTFVWSALYALWGLLQWGAISFFLAYYWLLGGQIFKLSYLLVLGGLGGFYFLNILFLFIQNCSIRRDHRLKSWLAGGCNACWYYTLSFLGVISTNKIKNLLFCKLFAFSVFSARLQSVHSLKFFNAFGFLSFIPSLAIIVGTSMLLHQTTVSYNQIFMGEVDVLVLSILSLVLAVCHAKKPEDYFQDADEDGIKINKRMDALDEVLNDQVMPSFHEQSQKSYLQRFESARKFNISSDSLSEVGDMKSLRDVSIQAEQLLGERSRISRFDTENFSNISIFQKNDVSLQMDYVKQVVDMSVGENVQVRDVSINPPSVHMHDVSIAADRPILLDVSVDQTPQIQNEVSIQYERQNKQVSIQYDQPEQQQISIQHVPIYTDDQVHMTREEESMAVQCNPLNQSKSIQYSAKPIVEQVDDPLPSEQSLTFSKQEASDLEVQKRLTQGVAPVEEGMKLELQLDLQEQLEQKQQKLQKLKQQRWEREKQQARRQFQQQVRQKQEQTKNQDPQLKEQDRLANMFNNEEGEAPSSLMHTQQIIEINLPPRPARQQTEKSEQQFINMLSGDKSSSNRQNLSKDSRLRGRVHIQSGNTFLGSNQDEAHEEEQENLQQELAQQTIDQFPSAEKSGSTANITGRGGQRGPVLQDSEVSFDFSRNEDEAINLHPLEPEYKNAVKKQQLDLAKKTNLNQFLSQKRANISSANYAPRRNLIMEEEDVLARQIQQRPLPPQRSQQFFNQKPSVPRSAFRKRSIKQEELQFNDKEHVFNPSDGLEDALEIQAKKILPRKRSQKKMVSHDVSGDRSFRGSSNGNKGYQRQTFTSEQKRRSLQKIYLNKLRK